MSTQYVVTISLSAEFGGVSYTDCDTMTDALECVRNLLANNPSFDHIKIEPSSNYE